MKKFLGIVLIAGALVACNNSGESTTSGDSTNADSASLNTLPPATSDSATLSDSASRVGDSASKAGDTTKTK